MSCLFGGVFAASAYPILYQGAEPVLLTLSQIVGIFPLLRLRTHFETHCLWKHAAVIVVNLYRQSADFDPIIEVYQYYGVPIIEDAAESLGAIIRCQECGFWYDWHFFF